jgi:hypothetical protein
MNSRSIVAHFMASLALGLSVYAEAASLAGARAARGRDGRVKMMKPGRTLIFQATLCPLP